jgi:hypothetical protein
VFGATSVLTGFSTDFAKASFWTKVALFQAVNATHSLMAVLTGSFSGTGFLWLFRCRVNPEFDATATAEFPRKTLRSVLLPLEQDDGTRASNSLTSQSVAASPVASMLVLDC